MLSFIALSIYIRLHKKELIEKTITQISAATGGQVKLENISVSLFKNFPYLSIELEKLQISDSLFAQHAHPFLAVQNIYARINPFALVIGKISLNQIQLSNGGFYLFTNKAGYTNAYLLSGKKNTPSSNNANTYKNIFDRIALNNITVTIEDLAHDKLFDFRVDQLNAVTKKTDSTIEFRIKESILARSLAFKKMKGTYIANQRLEGNYLLEYQIAKSELRYHNIGIKIAGQPFYFSGSLAFGNVQEFDLNIVTNQLSVDLAKKILTKPIAKAISLVSVFGPLNVTASIKGSLNGGDPLVIVNWATSNNSITTPLLDFTDCSFTGSYTNEIISGRERNDSNSKVTVHGFRGNWQGLVMTAKDVIITNLSDPTVRCDLTSIFPLAQLNTILQSDAIALTAGNGVLDLQYTGPFDHITTRNASVTGTLGIEKGTLQFAGPAAAISNCRANIRFINTDIIVDSLSGNLSGNPIRMWGTAKNTLTLLGDAKESVSLAWNVYAPVLNIDHINSILSRATVARPGASAKTGNSLSKTRRQLDELLSNGNITAHIGSDRIVYRRFEAAKLSADLLVTGTSFKLQNASLQHGNGSMRVSAEINGGAKGIFKMNSQIQMKNVDAQKIWYGFENFGIKDIGYKNIQGVLNSDAKIALSIDNMGHFDMKSVTGDASFSIKNGALVNFSPVMKLQEFMFKRRDFSNIRFAEIKDRLHFNNGAITIDRMEINSTVLSLFVSGVYGLAGNTDISIQVPLSNLKKRDSTFIPENSGGESRGGMSVFLRAKTGDDGTIKIKYDPFKRFRKK